MDYTIEVAAKDEEKGVRSPSSVIRVYAKGQFPNNAGETAYLVHEAFVSMSPGLLWEAIQGAARQAYEQGRQIGYVQANAECDAKTTADQLVPTEQLVSTGEE